MRKAAKPSMSGRVLTSAKALALRTPYLLDLAHAPSSSPMVFPVLPTNHQWFFRLNHQTTGFDTCPSAARQTASPQDPSLRRHDNAAVAHHELFKLSARSGRHGLARHRWPQLDRPSPPHGRRHEYPTRPHATARSIGTHPRQSQATPSTTARPCTCTPQPRAACLLGAR